MGERAEIVGGELKEEKEFGKDKDRKGIEGGRNQEDNNRPKGWKILT